MEKLWRMTCDRGPILSGSPELVSACKEAVHIAIIAVSDEINQRSVTARPVTSHEQIISDAH
jgi:hypothetical protein